MEECVEFRTTTVYMRLSIQNPVPTHMSWHWWGWWPTWGPSSERPDGDRRDTKREALPPDKAHELDSQVSGDTSDGKGTREVTNAREKRQLP